MKNSGLSNRFSSETRHVWLYWYDCMVCGMNGIDALHHIISPSTRHYIKGAHNESVFNSCPIHNQKCHVGNEAWLFNDKNLRALLWKTAEALQEMGYVPNQNDKVFLRMYGFLYSGKFALGEQKW